MGWLDGITDSVDMNMGELQEMMRNRLGVLQSMGLQRVRHDLVVEQQWDIDGFNFFLNKLSESSLKCLNQLALLLAIEKTVYSSNTDIRED